MVRKQDAVPTLAGKSTLGQQLDELRLLLERHRHACTTAGPRDVDRALELADAVAHAVGALGLSATPFDESLLTSITNRETEVLRMTALGYSNKEIASALDVSVKTVEVHKGNAMRKLGLLGRTDVVRFAILQGWLKTAEGF